MALPEISKIFLRLSACQQICNNKNSCKRTSTDYIPECFMDFLYFSKILRRILASCSARVNLLHVAVTYLHLQSGGSHQHNSGTPYLPCGFLSCLNSEKKDPPNRRLSLFIHVSNVYSLVRIVYHLFQKRLTCCNSEYHDRKELWAFKKFQYN